MCFDYGTEIIKQCYVSQAYCMSGILRLLLSSSLTVMLFPSFFLLNKGSNVIKWVSTVHSQEEVGRLL